MAVGGSGVYIDAKTSSLVRCWAASASLQTAEIRSDEEGCVDAPGCQFRLESNALLTLRQLHACSVAVGGSGVYIGAKDFLISEVLGGFSITADCGASALKEKDKGKVGRLTVQIGAHAAPAPPG